MSTITSDIGRGCGRSGVIYLAAVAIGLPLGLCGVLSTLFMVTTFDFSPGVLVFVALMWLLPFAVAIVVFVVVVRRRSAQLDALFLPLGMQGEPYMSWFRQYHGAVYGRPIDAYLWRGPYLQIELPTRLNTRLGITERQSDTDFFANMLGKQQLAFADPTLANLSVFAMDEQWTRALLSDPATMAALQRLTALGSSIFTRQQVLFRPGAAALLLSGNKRLFGIDIVPQQARMWVDDLVRVVQAAEALPAPQQIDQPSGAELVAQRLRTRNPYFEVWVMVGTFGFFIVMAIVVFAAVFLVTGLD